VFAGCSAGGALSGGLLIGHCVNDRLTRLSDEDLLSAHDQGQHSGEMDFRFTYVEISPVDDLAIGSLSPRVK
jgi:hypothetical protein